MKKLFYTIVLIVFLLNGLSCQSTDRQKEAQRQIDTTQINSEGVVIDNDTLSAVFAAYTKLKDNLVEDDSVQSKQAALMLAQALKDIHGCEQMSMLSETLAREQTLKAQRLAFSAISTDLVAMYKNAPLSAGKIYVIHCPMFNQKAGADWLSINTEIKNPYYGEQMLTCGKVMDEID